MSKPRRRDAIITLLRDSPIESQEKLVQALLDAGQRVTQATVSRDLAAIGAIKGRDGYSLPEAGTTGPTNFRASELQSTLRRHAITIQQAAAQVVIHTAPGHAGLLGVALDRWPPTGMVGAIAGDDTIFIATQSRAIAKQLRKLLDNMLNPSESPE